MTIAKTTDLLFEDPEPKVLHPSDAKKETPDGGCTEEKPCRMPILRWIHSDRCKQLVELGMAGVKKPKIPTFRAKHDEIILQAVKDGWTASNQALKVRWLEITRNGRPYRLWFKGQAVWLNSGTGFKGAYSFITDPREYPAGWVLAKALEAFDKFL